MDCTVTEFVCKSGGSYSIVSVSNVGGCDTLSGITASKLNCITPTPSSSSSSASSSAVLIQPDALTSQGISDMFHVTVVFYGIIIFLGFFLLVSSFFKR